MTPHDLIAAFEVLAGSPGGIDRLRELVLELAVRGKLVAQDPGDEPADVLLANVVEDVGWRIPERAPRGKRDPTIEGLAGVRDVPAGWAEVRLGDVLQLVNGRAYKRAELLDDGTPIIRIQNLNGGSNWYYSDLQLPDRQYCEDGDLLFAWSASFGPYIWSGERSIYHYHIWKLNLSDAVLRDFMHRVLMNLTDAVRAQSHGLAMLHMTKAKMERWPIWVPPLAEQHRIVTRVDELMGLLDRLEAARDARDATRTHLRDAALAALRDADDAEAVALAWSRIAENMDDLFTDPADVEPLRQTILQLAVRGRLVPQDPGDEPAEVLLERVAAEKVRLVKEKLIRKPRPLLPIDPEEVPFEVPEGWAWGSADDLSDPARLTSYGVLKPVWVEDGVPTVRISEMRSGVIDVAAVRHCSRERAAKFEKTRLFEGDILITKDGTIGKTAVVPPELDGGNITQHVIRLSVSRWLERDFVRLALDSPVCQAWMRGETKGVALKGVNVGDFRRMPVPVPPVAEQRRIVARVADLIAACAALETSLTCGKAAALQFASAAVHHLDA